MKIGFNEATARDCSSLEKDILLCDEVGFEAIELRIDMLKTYLENHTKAQLATLLDSARVRPVI